MRFCHGRMLLVTVAVSMVLPLAVLAQPGTLSQVGVSPRASHALRISSGDLLEVGVFDTPELSGRLRVNEAGEIKIPIAGMVRISGMTSDEAAAVLEDKLSGMEVLKDPHVSIFISEYATQGVTVAGEVKNPGIYPLLGSHGVVDLVSAAGGGTPVAGKAVTVTHRSDPEHPEVVQLDSKPGNITTNIDILPGDTIVVSRAGVVYVVGDVVKPGGFLLQGNDRLTVLQAVALAQGMNRTAAQNKARLIRKTLKGREELPVPLKQILTGKAIDPPLEDGDILFVPSSEAKNLAYRSMEATVGLATGLIIYGRL